LFKTFSSANESIADEPRLVNSKPTVLRTVDKSRPADWMANKQKKARVCSRCYLHFEITNDFLFEMIMTFVLI